MELMMAETLVAYQAVHSVDCLVITKVVMKAVLMVVCSVDY